MTESSSHEAAQLEARLTVLELVVCMMVRDKCLGLQKARLTFSPSTKP